MGLRKVGSFGIGRTIKKFKVFKNTVPTLIANQSERHFKGGFKTGGGKTDASVGGWQKRRSGAARNAGRAILVNTGALRRDVQKRLVSWRKIEIATSARTDKYARRHNRGLDGMPKREFLGKSRFLNKKNSVTIRREMRKVFI